MWSTEQWLARRFRALDWQTGHELLRMAIERRPELERVFDLLGPDECLWGTNTGARPPADAIPLRRSRRRPDPQRKLTQYFGPPTKVKRVYRQTKLEEHFGRRRRRLVQTTLDRYFQ